MTDSPRWVLSCRYLRALGLGLLRLPIRDYMELTFAELSMLMQAYSDAAEMQQGHDPFLTAEQAKADRDYLIRVAKERQNNGKG